MTESVTIKIEPCQIPVGEIRKYDDGTVYEHIGNHIWRPLKLHISELNKYATEPLVPLREVLALLQDRLNEATVTKRWEIVCTLESTIEDIKQEYGVRE